jgi:hypothetical protein
VIKPPRVRIFKAIKIGTLKKDPDFMEREAAFFPIIPGWVVFELITHSIKR